MKEVKRVKWRKEKGRKVWYVKKFSLNFNSFLLVISLHLVVFYLKDLSWIASDIDSMYHALIFDEFFSLNVCVNFWYKSIVFKCGCVLWQFWDPDFWKIVDKWVGNFFFKVVIHKCSKLFCNNIKSGSLRILRSL